MVVIAVFDINSYRFECRSDAHISKHFHDRIGKLVGGSLSMVLGSMMMALNISTLFWLVCAFLLIFVVMYIGHDLEKIHLRMEKIAKEMKS